MNPTVIQKRFEPSVNDINYLSLDKHVDIEPFYNHYKNAVNYSDHVVGEFLDVAKKRDLLKNSIIIITSDHGAEFYEHGFWGHNSAFTKEQVMAPFILYLPGKDAKKIDAITSHLDIAPTLLELMGSSINPIIHWEYHCLAILKKIEILLYPAVGGRVQSLQKKQRLSSLLKLII